VAVTTATNDIITYGISFCKSYFIFFNITYYLAISGSYGDLPII
jgi:hypothetical protein